MAFSGTDKFYVRSAEGARIRELYKSGEIAAGELPSRIAILFPEFSRFDSESLRQGIGRIRKAEGIRVRSARSKSMPNTTCVFVIDLSHTCLY